MSKQAAPPMMAIMLCLATFAAAPAVAQSRADSAQQYMMSQHHRQMYGLMKDMTQQMSEMTEQMLAGDLTPERRKHMAEGMDLMSTMMRRMSSLAAKPSMEDAESQKQLVQMRTQMDEMLRHPSMKPGAK